MLLLVASAVPLNLGSQWQLKVHTLATTECCYWGGGCGGFVSLRADNGGKKTANREMGYTTQKKLFGFSVLRR